MRRKKRHATHANHERWLVSYADFITLLFAFFVVLFASSQVNHRKVSQLAQAIQDAFQQLGIFDASFKQPPLNPNGPLPTDQVRLVNTRVAPAQMFAAMASVAQADREQESLGELRNKLSVELSPEIHRQVVTIVQNREGLVISLREIGFYPSGSATLKPSSLPAVRRIAMALLNRPENIRFDGYTDNVPIHNSRYASNWELSVARATNMVRLFISKFDFPPQRLSAAGYGQYHPIVSNATAQGRAMNRRVDIVVLAPRVPLLPLSANGKNETKPRPAPKPATEARADASTPKIMPAHLPTIPKFPSIGMVLPQSNSQAGSDSVSMQAGSKRSGTRSRVPPN